MYSIFNHLTRKDFQKKLPAGLWKNLREEIQPFRNYRSVIAAAIIIAVVVIISITVITATIVI